jgi:fructokinase
MKTVLCFGEVLWDAFGDVKKAGGAPMNVAWHLMQQGIPVYMASRVGMDTSGDELIGFLKESDLYSTLIQQDEQLPTCEVTVQLDEHQHARYVIPEPVAWDNIQPEDELIDKAKEVDAIVFGTLASRGATTRNTLFTLMDENTGPLRIFDVNLRAPHYSEDTIGTMAAKADVIKMNEEEADLLIGSSNGNLRDKIIEFQKKFHSKTICVTRGGNGAILWHDDEFYEHPGFKVQVADTVGAGDAFLATLIAGLLEERPPQQILNKACAIGAFVASHRGANPVYDADRINQIQAAV